MLTPVAPAPPVEYPAIEPVEHAVIVEPAPPSPQPTAIPTPVPAPVPAPLPTPEPAATPSVAPAPPVPVPPVTLPAEVSPEDAQFIALIADLQRFGTLPVEEARRELNVMTQTLARQRNDQNRVRLAMLYTVARTGPQDDLRTLQLLENVARSGPGSTAVKQLAAILYGQVAERVRAVREEQQKADAAVQKLEALRAMERSLLRDRSSGGGAGSGSGGGGGGGAGGGGGGGGR
jgi:hypothetical protein